jgi:putative heme-binding domain-containing protein
MSILRYLSFLGCFGGSLLSAWLGGAATGQTFRPVDSLETLLKQTPSQRLSQEIHRRGDPARGALVFYRSAAACVRCHASGDGPSPLGPNLADLSKGLSPDTLTDEYLIRALLYPSADIREEFAVHTLRTDEGLVVSGLIESEDEQQLTLRSAAEIDKPIRLAKANIEARSRSPQSMMPEGLISSFREVGDFYDLVAYVMAVARGGMAQAAALKPSAEQLAIKEDWSNLDHAGILSRLKSRDFESGKAIYHGYCVDCHGPDGNRPNLPAARAFGTQPMKFGADPFRMFMTLTRGNGLMGPMSHLTPHQRYEVVHYIREEFMKGKNPEYQKLDQAYLEGLPRGTEDGTALPLVVRDLGPAVGSHLYRQFESVLSFRVGDYSLSYDLHTMNQAAVWRDGFLQLTQTHHALPRGEGVIEPEGKLMPELSGWEWGHAGGFDYSRAELRPRGPMPASWMKYHGYVLDGHQVILQYAIDGRGLRESTFEGHLPHRLHRVLEIAPGPELVLAVAKGTGEAGLNPEPIGGGAQGTMRTQAAAADSLAWCSTATNETRVVAAVVGDVDGVSWSIDPEKRVILTIPASDTDRQLEILIDTSSGGEELSNFHRDVTRQRSLPARPRLSTLGRGGPLRWPAVLATTGYLGLQSGAYAVDTLTTPASTPWNTWFRTTALDFFPDGRMVVATYGGDLWLVSGIDDELMNLQWKRYASGLYEPFGVKVVEGQVYVTCRDRLVRLHDYNGDDEADFYENFSDDTDVAIHFHGFNFDLQTDSDGNFYYAKCGHGSDYALPGAVLRVSPDGTRQEVYCTGFRVPNGMGVLPDGRLTCSDNQGQWMPSSKINLLKPGGYYGWVPTYNDRGRWSADGGKIDVKQVVPPQSFDEPLVWMPHAFDNSSGGQLWVDDPRFGPLSGHLLHTSFGKGWLSYLMMQEVDGVSQAAIIKLPFDFRTGIMRGRVNPKDGQVYVAGLQGWNGGGRPGLLDQGIQRLRYTAQPAAMVTAARVEADGLRLDFSFPIDPASLDQPDAFVASHWNYLWKASYGSDMYSPTTGKVGADPLTLETAELSPDRRQLKLRYRELQPVDQLHLMMKLRAEDGTPFQEEVFWTIHRIPTPPPAP